MDNYDLIKLNQARQKMGDVKYQDQDKTRDVAKDVIEEISDIQNISMLRMKRLCEMDYDDSVLYEYGMLKDKLQKLCLKQFEVIKEISKLMSDIKYPTKDVKRVWFDD